MPPTSRSSITPVASRCRLGTTAAPCSLYTNASTGSPPDSPATIAACSGFPAKLPQCTLLPTTCIEFTANSPPHPPHPILQQLSPPQVCGWCLKSARVRGALATALTVCLRAAAGLLRHRACTTASHSTPRSDQGSPVRRRQAPFICTTPRPCPCRSLCSNVGSPLH